METGDVESHKFIDTGERYLEPSSRVFNEIREDHPQMNRNLILRLAVKACNDTLWKSIPFI